MIKTLGILLAIYVVGLLLYAAVRPDNFHIERTVIIKAPAEKLFPLIDNFKAWQAWTPYNKDPEMKKTFSGKVSGVGARYEWEGNKEVGKGSVEINEAIPNKRVVIDLHMIKPFESHNRVEFTLTQENSETKVIWAMDSRQNYIARLLGVFIDMDRMVGGDFETGLTNLKALAEK